MTQYLPGVPNPIYVTISTNSYIEAAVDLIPKRAVIVIGDMNTKVGKWNAGDTYSCLGS